MDHLTLFRHIGTNIAKNFTDPSILKIFWLIKYGYDPIIPSSQKNLYDVLFSFACFCGRLELAQKLCSENTIDKTWENYCAYRSALRNHNTLVFRWLMNTTDVPKKVYKLLFMYCCNLKNRIEEFSLLIKLHSDYLPFYDVFCKIEQTSNEKYKKILGDNGFLDDEHFLIGFTYLCAKDKNKVDFNIFMKYITITSKNMYLLVITTLKYDRYDIYENITHLHWKELNNEHQIGILKNISYYVDDKRYIHHLKNILYTEEVLEKAYSISIEKEHFNISDTSKPRQLWTY